MYLSNFSTVRRFAPFLLSTKSAWKRCVPFLFFLVCLGTHSTWATHIKAGEITIKPTGNALTFQITLTLYLDSTSVANTIGNPGGDLQELTALLNFGDGSNVPPVGLTKKEYIGNNTIKQVYVTTHNYTVPSGQPYIISYKQQNRNKYIVNIAGKNGSLSTDGLPFYIESAIYTDPSFGKVSSPQIKIPPIDNATPGQIFTHNPGATTDGSPATFGDSISYELTIPKLSSEQYVPEYLDPADPIYQGLATNGGPSTFKLNPLNGDLTWDTPAYFFAPGQDYALYNVAIKIIQWRKLEDGSTAILSYVIRDMQIKVKKIDNKRPELKIPKDTCLVLSAGSQLMDTIYVSDPDKGQRIIFNAYSELLPSLASFTLLKPSGSNPVTIGNPGKAVFLWKPLCSDIRNQPYQVTFKAEDNVVPDIRLATIKTWQIRIYGAKPDNLKVNYKNRGMQLTWHKYYCTNADSILIYRKDCDPDTFKTEPCHPLAYLQAGFRQVGSVSGKDSTYFDTYNIHQGSYYCYVIVARFPGRNGSAEYAGGVSFSSDQACSSSYVETALLTNVTVETTDTSNGKIRVSWLNGIQEQKDSLYECRLFRAEGIHGGNYKEIFTSSSLKDTTFSDDLPIINTRDTMYNYRLEVYKNSRLISESDTASSVFLNTIPSAGQITLQWRYNVPWNNKEYLHFIYRKKYSEASFILIDSTSASESSGSYTDANLSLLDTFCYYIETRGRYCFDSLPSYLINASQVSCETPSVPPCPPILSLADEICDIPFDQALTKPFRNYLSWKNNSDPLCNIGLKGYKLYFAPHEGDDFVFLRFFGKDTLKYVHENFDSQAGCYAVTSVNLSNYESTKSNIECNDNCIYYELPNLVTANGDSLNEFFSALDFPRGVASVELFIYNRWGSLVHYQNEKENVALDWDVSKENLSDGVYFYHAKVLFARRQKAIDERKEIKGWLQIISKTNN